MTATEGEVRVRWLDGLGSCPGAVDLTLIGPAGPTDPLDGEVAPGARRDATP
jgi:hypothetical protein